jgi:DNA polymerase-1
LDHPNNPNTPVYQQTSQSIVKAEQKTESIAIEDHANLSSQDDQLGEATYHTVLEQADWELLLQRMQQADHFAIDTETTNLDYRVAELVGFSIAFDANEAYYVPLAHDYEGAPEQLNREQVLAQIKPILENEQVKKIGHHLKYDAHIFANHGITIQGWYFDTMLASYVLNAAATRHGMDDVARVYLSHLTLLSNKLQVKALSKKPLIRLNSKLQHIMQPKMHMSLIVCMKYFLQN